MALDPSIILRAGQTADIMGAIGQGNALASQAIEMQRGNALNAFLRQNGQGLLAGDQNALTGLAQFDPTMALNIQTQNRNNARADEQLAFDRQRLAQQDQRQARQDERADQEWQFKVEEYRRTVSAEQAAADAAEIESAVKMGLGLPDAATWDATMAQQAPDLVGKFDQREAIAQQYLSIAEILKGQQGPTPLSSAGKVQADINAGLLPAGTPLRGEAVTVNMPGQNDFDEAFAKGDAAIMGTISDAGLSARRNMGRIDRLESLLSAGPSGTEAGVKAMLGEYGIQTEGLSTLQAAQALINTMVPEQRQPGSGPMSDADLALFKQSLPRLINSPDGNAMITQTLRSIAQYDAEGAAIVQRVRNGEISRAEAFQALQSRVNPLEGFSKGASRFETPQDAPKLSGVPEGVDADLWGAMTPEEQALWQ